MRLLLYARNATSQLLTLAQWHGRRNETAIELQNQRFTRTSYPARQASPTSEARESMSTIRHNRRPGDCVLCGAATARSELANVVQKDRTLQ